MKIVAHRGYSARFPENSLMSFEQAIAAGAELIETDVRITRDGVAVCWHDADFKRVANIERAIADSTHASLTRIALPGGARIQTLAQVLALAHERSAVLLDVKLDSAPVRRAIIDAVSASGMDRSVVYGVRSAAHAGALIREGARFDRLAMPATPADLDTFPSVGLIGARLWEEQIDSASIERIRVRGLEVWITAGLRARGETPGTITPERLRTLMALGADAVLVNDIGLACAALGRPSKGLRS